MKRNKTRSIDSSTQNRKGSVRIIGGNWRGRKLSFHPVEGLRPTGDRVKETLFNWLQPYIFNSRCLDLFAGSGSLGFEAASRGASEVVMVDLSKKVSETLKENVLTFESDSITVVNADSTYWIKDCNEEFDLVFLDPPFSDGLLPQLLQEVQKNLSNENGLVYFERASSDTVDIPFGYEVLKQKRIGEVYLCLIRAV